jgi:hypothetical protein
MPKRAPDQGAKPFEMRTGIGGVPMLGGMFRSGDPSVTPPHKFHLLVNMRRTPAGAITRPGLTLEFDTGVQECIDGLTEDAGENASALLLYPGATAIPSNGTPNHNPATFRSVFPGTSDVYSEFSLALYGPASTTRGNMSPVLAFNAPGTGYSGPLYLSRPFLFRGQVVQFALVDRNGVDTVALVGINLARRSFLQASDCWRDTTRPYEGSPPTTPICPGLAGLPAVAGDDPPLWPYQHPVDSVNVLVYFDNPFAPPLPPSTFWHIWAASTDPAIFPSISSLVVESIITMQERIDNVQTGVAGVGEVLYFAVVAPATFDYRIVRWDGAVQTNDYVLPPGMVVSFMSKTNVGPYLVQNATSAKRLENGTWAVGGGLLYTVGTGPDDYLIGGPTIRKALSWGGIGVAVGDGASGGAYRCPDPVLGPGFGFTNHVHPQTATGWDSRRSARVATLDDRCPAEGTFVFVTIDAVICGSRIYAIAGRIGGPESAFSVLIGDFNNPLIPVIPGGLKVSRSGFVPQTLWIQEVGGRVYVGGKFDSWDPITQAAEPGIVHHGVYDVTDLPATIFAAYRVDATDQDFDDEPTRYSQGCLPGLPNDDNGGEGFQGS